MRSLAILLLAGASLWGQAATQVTGYLSTNFGPSTGRVTLSWTPMYSTQNQFIPSGRRVVEITAGFFSVPLLPSSTGTYRAEFFVDRGSTWSENWKVPESNISVDYRTLSGVLTGQTFTQVGGTKWFTGTGAPGNLVGSGGDFYIDQASGNYYTRGTLSWSLTGNLRGPSGATGSTGTSGAAGATGAQGPAGATGPAGPAGGGDGTGYSPAVYVYSLGSCSVSDVADTDCAVTLPQTPVNGTPIVATADDFFTSSAIVTSEGITSITLTVPSTFYVASPGTPLKVSFLYWH